ncbi:hypothetical protein [Rugamonas apoptosis]|uniref:Uncharacterized protein n=1 Tax=Rugamonas apoptosis TaxID=2758570 RepID=A0A7W2FFI6_9BURK|nr:hypothetical protein [Rugamonas apoptosis]MBA5690639.1 hypothetical protein [Rugamonas apoptosis]
MTTRILACMVLLLCGAGAQAAGMSSNHHPKDYCGLGAEVGLPSSSYTNGVCGSKYVDVGSAPGANGLINNLSFYSMGDFDNPTTLKHVSFILNVNNPADG